MLLIIGVLFLVGMLVVALNRRHIRGRGVSGQASVLRVDAHKDLRTGSVIFYVVQLAIARPDGTEIVAAVTVFGDPPQPGWTVPVRYLERLGNTTKVATDGPFKPSRR
ncbi:hypothetical protein Caci_5037 [Catenulispora acidiphila DSM 44928]|uniref:DUF3592 domain-containing protein n=1 Tax=Catenulispora acidiphila (strain DSM 44928 / JCM 14897 / NBRC 102108 / NRRL B-24433 / ID139908) TaxID=479433 RepID=C7Q4U9_CATAD|nr:hypothetical protein [Catenulispora acidiphila]ACU73897.1 hypothetical protein Caci_5037 [Catenulispora acidiphila DSM 44928]